MDQHTQSGESDMYRTWTASADDAVTLARELEIHLNEYAEAVLSVSYSVDTAHHVLVVYTPIDPSELAAQRAVFAEVEQLIDSAPG
jgi:hypothetical protein